MTLMEIMVAMAIVGVIFAVAAVGLRSAFNVNLKSTAGKMAATLRYLSNKAVTEHRYIRVIFDMKAQTYTVEECTEPVVVSVEDEENQAEIDKKTKDNPEPAAEPGDDGKEEEKQTADSSCVPSESSLLKPVKLPSDVFFKDIRVSYLQFRKEEGKATTYFFPDGYATPTLINLKNEDDDDHFSVEVEALSGKVKLTSDYQENFSGWGKNDEK